MPDKEKVNKEAMRLWVAALRSKKYKQGSGSLAYLHEGQMLYCCLGVLCEVALEAGGPVTAHTDNKDGVRRYDGAYAVLPASVTVWAGLPDYDPYVGYDSAGGRVHATSANDSRNWSFEKIAESLEEYYGLKKGPGSDES